MVIKQPAIFSIIETQAFVILQVTASILPQIIIKHCGKLYFMLKMLNNYSDIVIYDT